MPEEIIKLRFIGKDDSMGLKHGEVYNCTLHVSNGYTWVSWKDFITYRTCPYSSIGRFLHNWQLAQDAQKSPSIMEGVDIYEAYGDLFTYAVA